MYYPPTPSQIIFNMIINIEIDTVYSVGAMSELTWKQATEIPVDVDLYIPHQTMSIPPLLHHQFPPIIGADSPLPKLLCHSRMME